MSWLCHWTDEQVPSHQCGQSKRLVLGQLLLAIKMLWYQYLLRIRRMSRLALQCMYYVLCNHIIDIKSLFYVSSILAMLGIIAFLRDGLPTTESGCSPYLLAVLPVTPDQLQNLHYTPKLASGLTRKVSNLEMISWFIQGKKLCRVRDSLGSWSQSTILHIKTSITKDGPTPQMLISTCRSPALVYRSTTLSQTKAKKKKKKDRTRWLPSCQGKKMKQKEEEVAKNT